MWTRRLVGDKFKGPPTKTFEEATEFYKETIDAVKGAYEFFCRISELIKLLEQETLVVSSTLSSVIPGIPGNGNGNHKFKK